MIETRPRRAAAPRKAEVVASRGTGRPPRRLREPFAASVPAKARRDNVGNARPRSLVGLRDLVPCRAVFLCDPGDGSTPLAGDRPAECPRFGRRLLVCNHVSFFDVFFLGIPLRRPLNYVARSTLFIPVLGSFIRSVGAFPIQREGIGASGMKETLRRLRAGGIVTLFPEGTRSHDGQLGPLKPGIAVLVERVGVPVVPAGLAGMFEIWPRSRLDSGAASHPGPLRSADSSRRTGRARHRGDHRLDSRSHGRELPGSPSCVSRAT